MKYLGELGATKSFGYSVAILFTAVAIGASFGSNSANQRHIEIKYPELVSRLGKPCSAEDPLPCAAEAAALAVALANLEAARQSAEELYEAWAACVDANPNPNPNPNPPHMVGMASVLETVK